MSSDFPPPPFAQPIAGATAPIQQDLYCLTCGYNLRGLSGDPVPCPECGDRNPLETLMMPAPLIHAALRKMETAPTANVACTLFFVLFALMALTLAFELGSERSIDAAILGLPALLAALVWPLTYVRMKRSYDGCNGWRRVLSDFNLAGLLCTLWYPGLIGFVIADQAVSGGLPRGSGWLTLILVVSAMVWGLRVYKRGKKTLAWMQRETATRMAREVLARSRVAGSN